MTREDLRQRHGTPAQFASAVWAAWAQLFVTTAEAYKAIKDYEREWCDAEPGSAAQ